MITTAPGHCILDNSNYDDNDSSNLIYIAITKNENNDDGSGGDFLLISNFIKCTTDLSLYMLRRMLSPSSVIYINNS